jgi:hypothetical protein
MKPVIFSGPTLWRDPIASLRALAWLPPAKDGDVYKAARERPKAIGIIDGEFETAPSVWHKEILWALSQGIHVFGAASMGALRAAELSSFGMRGIGRIFSDYEKGILTDDDEVAVLHAAAELGYRPLSESLVDIRATVARAEATGVLSSRTATAIVVRAKATFFKERTWSRVLHESAGSPARKREMANFSRWLKDNRVELKREDARAMVRAIETLIQSDAAPFKADFAFQRTSYWRRLVASNGGPRNRRAGLAPIEHRLSDVTAEIVNLRCPLSSTRPCYPQR